VRLCDVDAAQTLAMQREELQGRIRLVESGNFTIVIGKLPIIDLADIARGSIVAELHHRVALIDDRLVQLGIIVTD
jgi:hypothetical protein